MNNLSVMRNLQLVAGGAMLMFASLSHAQFVWVDAKGMKQFSDRPPPQGTPLKNIIKARNMPTAALPAPVAAGAPVAAKAAPATLSDREADYRKRKTEQAEVEKKASADADQARTKAAACTAARQNKAMIDTGAPMRDTDAERSWLSDKQRAERRAAAEKTIAEHCS